MARNLASEELEYHEHRLAKDGFAVLEQILSDEDVEDVLAELRPMQLQTPYGDNDFTGFKTRRVFNLIAKTRALDALLLHKDVLQLTRSALGPSIQLSIASTMEIFPGETPQALHQDDAYFRLQRPHPALVMNTMWALTDFTETNGATRLVPGSTHVDRPVSPNEPSIPACMPKGSVLLWDGALWHGGGANDSDEIRFGVSLNYCRGWIRQQENQYLSIPKSVAKTLPRDLIKLVGYDICEFVGYVDRQHPLQALRDAV